MFLLSIHIDDVSQEKTNKSGRMQIKVDVGVLITNIINLIKLGK